MYTRLNKELNEFLNSFEISTHTCDVFEEIVLNKLASIETQPEKCRFGSINENRMYFKIKGISDSDAEKFLKFLKETNGDKTATKGYISTPDTNEFDSEAIYETHVFYVNAETIYNKVFPQFKHKIVEINENPTEKFQQYKDLSEDDPEVKIFKLSTLLDDVIKETADLESNCVDAYSKGELHIIFKLLDERLRLYKEHLPHGCGSFASDVQENIGMFEEACEENLFLQNDEATVKLKEHLNKVRNSMPVPMAAPNLRLFSMFNPHSITSTQNLREEDFDQSDERVNSCRLV